METPSKAPARSRTCVLYVRTSTQQQKHAETIGAQIETVRGIVERLSLRPLRYGAKADGWVVDDGRTGAVLGGRDFGQLISDIETGKVRPDVVVVPSLSRLAREDRTGGMARQVQSAQDWGRIKAVLRAAHVVIIDADGENDPANVLFDLKTSLSGEEYKLIRARTMGGKARCLREGRFAGGGKAPFGYVQVQIDPTDRSKGYTLALHPEHAHRVKKALRWYVEGGYAHAARKAEAKGWPPAGANTRRELKGVGWNDTVVTLVKNARNYLGSKEVTLAGETYTIRFPPVIDAELYADIQRARKEHTIGKRTEFLTTGYLRCSCGRPAYAHITRGKAVLTCRNYCGRTHGNAVSAVLWDMVVSRLVQIKKLESSAAPKERNAKALKLAREAVTKLEGQILILADALIDGMPKTAWKTKNAELTERLIIAQADVDRLNREQAEAEGKAKAQASVAERVDALLAELDVERGNLRLERRREILGDLLAGGRATVTWAGEPQMTTLTLPPWGQLPAVSRKVDPSKVWIRQIETV